jgi:hypothetical protein
LLNEKNEYLTKRLDQIEETFYVTNELQFQQLDELKIKHQDDVLTLENKTKTYTKELNAFSFIFAEQIQSLEKNVSTLNESNQNKTNQLSELKYKHDVDSLELKENQNKKITTLNRTFNELVENLKEKFSLMSIRVNDLNQTLVSENIKKKITYSLSYNVSIQHMISQGYKKIYDFGYDHITTLAELNAIKSNCSSESILCAGGAALNSDNLLLISCGNCHTVLAETLINKPVLNNGAYWYLTTGKSFGFSPGYIIKQFSGTYWFSSYRKIIFLS